MSDRHRTRAGPSSIRRKLCVPCIVACMGVGLRLHLPAVQHDWSLHCRRCPSCCCDGSPSPFASRPSSPSHLQNAGHAHANIPAGTGGEYSILPPARSTVLTIVDSKFDSAAVRVLNMRECVDVIVFHVSHPHPLPTMDILHIDWTRSLVNLLTVNIHFFASVTQHLWSYIPCCDILTAIPSKIPFSTWQQVSPGAQYE